ncbi:MAG: hypothetical protein ACHQE6_00985 [Solirubrobacterales bacterium]
MQAAFPIVVFGSIGLFVVVGVLSMLTRGSLHEQIGQGGLFSGDDPVGDGGAPHGAGISDGAPGWSGDEGPGGLESSAERELEIRQMLVARSERLVRQGHPPLDVEAELARLERVETGPPGSGDPALAEEVRQLVLARNERRQRQGLDALDVETEVQRTLAELNPQ